MANMTTKSGNCSNFGNCSIADTRATVEVPSSMDFVCNECGKPLLIMDASRVGNNKKALTMTVVIVVVLAVGAGAIWSLLGTKGKTSPEVTPTVPSDVVGAPAPRQSGDCSVKDQKAGLCTRTP